LAFIGQVSDIVFILTILPNEAHVIMDHRFFTSFGEIRVFHNIELFEDAFACPVVMSIVIHYINSSKLSFDWALDDLWFNDVFILVVEDRDEKDVFLFHGDVLLLLY
jgi:hypothetical protein